MNHLKRLLISALAAALCLGWAPLPQAMAAAAAPQAVQSQSGETSSAAARLAALEERYDIQIILPEYAIASGAADTYLDELEIALRDMTPQLVSRISRHYREQYQKEFTVEYTTYSQEYYEAGVTGMFELENGLLHLYITETGPAGPLGGWDRQTITHEFGHAFHQMCMDLRNEPVFYAHWIALNGRYAYDGAGSGRNPAPTIFASGYATASYREDFAEVFAGVFSGYGDQCSFYRQLARSQGSSLETKTKYVAGLVKEFLPEEANTIQHAYRVFGDRTGTGEDNLGSPGAYRTGDVTRSGKLVNLDGFRSGSSFILVSSYADGPEPSGTEGNQLLQEKYRGCDSRWISGYGLWVVDAPAGQVYVSPQPVEIL